MTTATVNTDWARKNEGYIYGEGTATLSEKIAKAARGRKTAKGQANAAHEAICTVCRSHGMNPDIEVFMREEGKGERRFFRVSWESGPYGWASVASDALCQIGVFAEPYYSFDLCFYPSEDGR